MGELTKATLGRLPKYLKYLQSLSDTNEFVSSTNIASAMGFGEVQVKKDLNSVSENGKPRVGYKKQLLIKDIERIISEKSTNIVLVGVGKIGSAILGYNGFNKFGLNISVAFDSDENKVNSVVNGKQVLHISSLKSYCKKNSTKIGIITVPSKYAQEVCNLLVESGVKAIWNFAPAKLVIPKDVVLKQEDLALSLAFIDLQVKD